MNIADAVLFAPSIRQLIEDMSHVLLGAHRSLIVLVPLGVSATDVGDLLRSELGRRDADMREVPSIKSGMTPLEALAQALGVSLEQALGPSPITALLEYASQFSQHPDILYLDGFEQSTQVECQAWFAFLEGWAEVMRHRTNQGQPTVALCAIISDAIWNDRTLNHSQMIDIRHWWGVPSVIETRLLCRAHTPNNECRDAWREHVLPSVAGGDLELISLLWDHIADEWDRLSEHLSGYASGRGWSLELLKEWGADNVSKHPQASTHATTLAPTASFRTLWAQGALHWTVEHGVELNVAALAFLGRNDILCYRFWRGQVQYVFTFVNDIRLAACDHLSVVYGADWPEKLISPDDEQEHAELIKNPSSCEFDHLCKLLATRNEPTKWERWKILVERAKKMRNTVAHYKPISYATFEELWHLRSRIAS